MTLGDLRRGGKSALARALVLVETEGDGAQVLLDEALAAQRGHAIGFTGPPGAGKSTLIDALIPAFRQTEKTVGVIAVDPSSQSSGGALLGDRTRLTTDPGDPGVFVRSMAARDRLGGVADLTFPALVVMRALFDLVIIETVGVGQSETAIAETADTVVYCAQPAAGDALQFMKAGIMEVHDLVVVTKADIGAPARRAVSDLRASLSLTSPSVHVIACSARDGTGIDELTTALDVAIADGRDTASERHRAQAMRWLKQRITARFGSEGWRHVSARIPQVNESALFQNAFMVNSRLSDAIREAFS